jgi:hemerythrin-like domain-containing protein
MTDVFEVLSADHADVKSMLIALESSTDAAGGGSSAVLAARKEVAEQLVIASSQHEAAEEQYFWPAVREQLGNGNQLADQAIAQESEAKEVLARIDKLEAGDPEFSQLLTEFTPAARQHIEFEESQVWPGMRQALSPQQAQELGEKISKAEERGPTRPHPGTPASPAVLKAAGPAVAAIDKLRDAMSGRGKPGKS